MATTYSLAPIPKWVLINNEGTVAGGAKLYTYRSLNKIEQKPVFQDAGGTIPWTNPIIFDLNGVQGPFYWQVDSGDLSDTYYLEAYDSEDNLLWTLDDYFPPGSGGGGDVTTFIPLTNYITNNQFINHIEPVNNPGTNVLIAPSNHKGFTPAQVSPIVGTYGVVGPDIRFIKNNTAATDSIDFPLFPLASAPLTGDVTPVDYIEYQSTGVLGETYKCFQFPITQKVKNLSNQQLTFTLWASSTTNSTIDIYSRQYYGSAPSATPESTDTRQLFDSYDLSITWTQYVTKFSMPSVEGNSIGALGSQTDDDAVYMQIQMPLTEACVVRFTKPCLFLGSIDESLEFDSYDQIDSIDSTPRTGDIKTSLLALPPLGWLAMDDGTIGNVSSGADTEGAYTFQLYSTLYTSVSDAWAPVSTGRTAPGTTMANAVTDFLAGKTLTLPRSLGRALAGAGSATGLTTARALGEYVGAESHTLIGAELPPHTHTYSKPTSVGVPGVFASGSSIADNTLNTGNGPGTSTPFSIMEPTSFFNVFIKL